MNDSFKMAERGAVRYLVSERLNACDGIQHAFLTRWGGASRGPFSNLNFSTRVGDQPDQVAQNRTLLTARFDLPRLFTMHQVHGDRVLVLKEPATVPASESAEADAVITAIPGIAIGIKTADCVPILIADPCRRVIGAIHAGWRSTAMRIAAKTVETLRTECGSDPADLLAAIGPCIGPCCYEVDQTVHGGMADAEADHAFVSTGNGKWRLDLAAVNRRQLMTAGLHPSRIHTAELCTACHTDLFFSHRGERGNTGRQYNFIRLN